MDITVLRRLHQAMNTADMALMDLMGRDHTARLLQAMNTVTMDLMVRDHAARHPHQASNTAVDMNITVQDHTARHPHQATNMVSMDTMVQDHAVRHLPAMNTVSMDIMARGLPDLRPHQALITPDRQTTT